MNRKKRERQGCQNNEERKRKSKGKGQVFGGAHTVNEGVFLVRSCGDTADGLHFLATAIRAEGFLEKVRFYSRLILNADETNLL